MDNLIIDWREEQTNDEKYNTTSIRPCKYELVQFDKVRQVSPSFARYLERQLTLRN